MEFDEVFGEITFPKISATDISWLTKDFDAAKVWNALKSMHPTKAPRPDGIMQCFFKNSGILLDPLLHI